MEEALARPFSQDEVIPGNSRFANDRGLDCAVVLSDLATHQTRSICLKCQKTRQRRQEPEG